jgi:hypothetical protein
MTEQELEPIRYRLRTCDTSALGCRDFAEHVRDDMEALIEAVEASDLAEAELAEVCHASIGELIEFFREEGPYLSEIRAKLAKLEALELSTKR